MWKIILKGGALRLLVAKEEEIIYLIIAIKYSLLFYPNKSKLEEIIFIVFLQISRNWRKISQINRQIIAKSFLNIHNHFCPNLAIAGDNGPQLMTKIFNY
jgi:hypothetical protein